MGRGSGVRDRTRFRRTAVLHCRTYRLRDSHLHGTEEDNRGSPEYPSDTCPPTFFQQLFESAAALRMGTLHSLAQDIGTATPDITGGTQLSVQQYGATARIFGIKRRGRWRLYVNRPVGGGYQTELLYG